MPWTAKRGLPPATSIDACRTTRRPGYCSTQCAQSSTGAPGRRAARSASTRSGTPKSRSAWSTRCGPRSNQMPPPGTAASRQRSRTVGRKRSIRDSRWTTSPSRPERTSSAMPRKSLSKRRFWNTRSTRPVSAARSRSSRASARLSVKGLSTTTCLPALRAVRASGVCWSFGAAITTRSTSWRARSASTSGTTTTSGRSACTASGRLETTWVRASPSVAWSRGTWNVFPANP